MIGGESEPALTQFGLGHKKAIEKGYACPYNPSCRISIDVEEYPSGRRGGLGKLVGG